MSCVRLLLDRGCLGKRHALAILLEAVVAEAGEEQQARFRSLIAELDKQCSIGAVRPGTVDECPFVGLDAYRSDQAHLFFGRQQETLDALACFDTGRGGTVVRWLEINGNSGSGKSSLMNAGLLPRVDDGWLSSRTRYSPKAWFASLLQAV